MTSELRKRDPRLNGGEKRKRAIHTVHWKRCKHIGAYKTSFGKNYCPDCDRNI